MSATSFKANCECAKNGAHVLVHKERRVYLRLIRANSFKKKSPRFPGGTFCKCKFKLTDYPPETITVSGLGHGVVSIHLFAPVPAAFHVLTLM